MLRKITLAAFAALLATHLAVFLPAVRASTAYALQPDTPEAPAHAARAGQTAGRMLNIIIDTDMGLDDVRAIFALLSDSSCSVRCIVTIEGSASLGKGTDNLIGLLENIDMDDVPIYRGLRRPDTAPPPWRGTADALAGNPFPPPRHITARDFHESLHDLIMDSEAPLHYIALGPLGNLAALEPEAIEMIESIYIPAVVNKGNLEGWNLSFDPESAFDVLSRAGSVVIVDVGSTHSLDAQSILDSVDGSSAAARWIESLGSAVEGHLMIYDEIAAVALARPGLTEIDPERYKIARLGNETFRLERSDEGTIRIARIKDAGAVARELVELWERTEDSDHHDHHASPEDAHIDTELYIKTFHGHLGPYLVLGYRMGLIALRELDSAGHFGLFAIVHSRLKPPESCLIDGVQLGSGCTLGKRNIEIAETAGPAFAEFESERGERITISLRGDIPRLIADLIRESGVEDAGDRIFHMGEESLFEVRRQE